MRIAFGADHAGFELKDLLARYAAGLGHEVCRPARPPPPLSPPCEKSTLPCEFFKRLKGRGEASFSLPPHMLALNGSTWSAYLAGGDHDNHGLHRTSPRAAR